MNWKKNVNIVSFIASNDSLSIITTIYDISLSTSRVILIYQYRVLSCGIPACFQYMLRF